MILELYARIWTYNFGHSSQGFEHTTLDTLGKDLDTQLWTLQASVIPLSHILILSVFHLPLTELFIFPGFYREESSSHFLLSLLVGFFYFFSGPSQLEFDPNAKKVTHVLKSNSWFNCQKRFEDILSGIFYLKLTVFHPSLCELKKFVLPICAMTEPDGNCGSPQADPRGHRTSRSTPQLVCCYLERMGSLLGSK